MYRVLFSYGIIHQNNNYNMTYRRQDMQNQNNDIYKMYGKESQASKNDFIKKYNVNENRTYRLSSRRKNKEFRIK